MVQISMRGLSQIFEWLTGSEARLEQEMESPFFIRAHSGATIVPEVLA